VKGVTLAAIAKELDLGECLKLGSGERKSGGQDRESILADAVEAMIGAIYLDGGMAICEGCILTWFASRLQLLDLDHSQKDAKTRLQEYLQARGQHLPVYELVRLTGQDHKQVFVMSCTVQVLGKTMVAQASSRRMGEQKAAAKVLQLLEQANL
jgi:ribonuclease-3